MIMTLRNGTPKLIALVFTLNGVLCPCAGAVNQIEDAPQAHHHAQTDAKNDCHGSASTKECTSIMAETALPKSLPSAPDQYQADDPASVSYPIRHESPGRHFSVRGAPDQKDYLAARSTPVSRNDRLLD